MAELLYKFYEADDVAAASGTPLVAGSATRDFVIPDGELWKIDKFSGSSQKAECEVELLYSDDGGSTWSNPFDSGTDKLVCLHLSGHVDGTTFPPGFEFQGSGTDIVIRMKVKNYNTDSVAEIACWMEGLIK